VQLNQNDHRTQAQLCRRLAHIHKLDPGWDLDFVAVRTMAHRIAITKATTLGVRMALEAQKRTDKATAIQEKVHAIQESFRDRPSKFWRRMRRTLDNATKFLTEVYVTDEFGIRIPSSATADLHRAVTAMYTPHCESRGESTKPAMEQILRSLHQHNADDHTEAGALHATFSTKEVKDALSVAPLGKAAGRDTIHAEIIRNATAASDVFAHIVTEAFNHAQTHGIPPSMRESITILLHKKDDAHLITNYRPIALTQALYKTYASILSKRLVKFLGLNPALLDDAQTGFLPSRGVSQKLLAITTAFSEANRDETELHLQSNDFYKCFDSIEHWYLKLCLEHMKLPAQFIDTVMDTLKHLTTRF
jgi:hypothetical protein